MFGLGIHYLMGWAMAAADGAKKEQAEWPPHPDRVFMALAAGWFETGQEETEGAALQWLENLSPPFLSVSAAESRHAYGERLPTTSYVPVNDTRMSLGQLPDEHRSRRPRKFPVTIPVDPIVFLSWKEDLPTIFRKPLESLCQKVISIGHPASLVQMWVTETPPSATLFPVKGLAEYRLRVTGKGRLEYLATRCNRQAVIEWADMNSRISEAKGKDKKLLQAQLASAFPGDEPVSLRPEPSIWHGYNVHTHENHESIPASLFNSHLIILTLSNNRLSLPITLKLTEAVRGALLKVCPEPVPEWISGHALDGSRSAIPHLAFLPLPFVDREYADGHLMGLALAIPNDIDPAEASHILGQWLTDERGTPRVIRIFNGQWLECYLELDSREMPPWSLRSATWTGPARIWATVTPVALDRHYNGSAKWEKAAESVKDSCERIGLPRPIETMLHPVSMFEGVPRSNHFPCLTRKHDGGRMHHAHAVLVFEKEVLGPIILGAGRFRGYGLCRPVIQGGQDHA